MEQDIIYQEQQDETQEQEQLQVAVPKMQQEVSIWNDQDTFKRNFEIAKYMASSDLIPQAYKGKPANVMIAVGIGNRLGLDPMIVMQNSQVVQGNFTWKGTACKAMIDGCGVFLNTRYVEVGERGKDSWGVYLEGTRKSDNAIIRGVTVTIAMAKAEGWYNKNGSKWQTMPELMLRYRAAAFFMRTECSAIAMGFLTSEEQEDITPNAPSTKESIMQALDGEED